MYRKKKSWESYKIKIFIFLLLFVVSSNVSHASEAEHLMNQGNEYYQKNDFSKAATIYKKIVNDGYQSTALYYNLGNTYYRLGKIGYAILYYEKALRLAPNDEDILHNLAIANTKTVDKIETLPKFFLFQWWESLLALFSISGWTYAAFVIYILLLISIGLYFFIKRSMFQRIIFFSGIGLIILLLITISLLIVNVNRAENNKQGVILVQSASVKVSPDQSSSDAFVIHEGLKVGLEDRVDNWIKIRLRDGKIGWLPVNDLETI